MSYFISNLRVFEVYYLFLAQRSHIDIIMSTIFIDLQEIISVFALYKQVQFFQQHGVADLWRKI